MTLTASDITVAPELAPAALRDTVTWDSVETVRAAAARLRSAQHEWESAGPGERREQLGLFARWISANRDDVIDSLISETGKSYSDAATEIPVALQVLGYYGKNAERFLKSDHPKASTPFLFNKRIEVSYRPHPLVGIISPWNYPIAIPFMDGAPALAAGAAVLIKPSELTPVTIGMLVDAWKSLGGPEVFAVANGGADVAQTLIDEADYIQFTGSSRTGRSVLERAARTMTPVGLELGGKDPMIVLSDADLERASNAAVWGGMFNAGQTCVSVERVYVEAPVYDRFVELVTRKVKALGLANTGSVDAEVGAIIDNRQLATIEKHVDDAVAAGARAVTGGKRESDGSGFPYYAPTVLLDVDHSMLCMREETFGPTLPIMKVVDEREAVRLANDSPYGLSAAVFSADHDRARRVARQLDVGAVNINDVIINMMAASAPQGGWKTSGVGARFGGAAGLRKFCRAETIVTNIGPLRSEPLWYSMNGRIRRAAIRALSIDAVQRVRH
ncbi:aldehyde dehydrogenase family protein [Gordonia sputi]